MLLPAILTTVLLASCHDDPEPNVPYAPDGYSPECGAFIIQDGDTLDWSGQTLYLTKGEKVIGFDMYYFGPDFKAAEDVLAVSPAACVSIGEDIHIEEEYLSLSLFSYQPEDFKVDFSRPEEESPYAKYWDPVKCRESNVKLTDQLFQSCPIYKRHLRVEFLSDRPPVKSDGFLIELNLSLFRSTYYMNSVFKIYSETK